MRLEFSPHLARSYRKAPAEIQRAFDKQSLLLLHDLPTRPCTPRSTTKDLTSGKRASPVTGASISKSRAIPTGLKRFNATPRSSQLAGKQPGANE